MADLKKSFDEVAEAGKSLAGGNVMTSLQTQVGEALRIDSVDAPAPAAPDLPAADASGGTAEDGHVLLPPVAQDIQPQAAVEEAVPAPPDIQRDAKAS
jgi:sec-independent protein translocase protein TatB